MARKKRGQNICGLVLLDKPRGLSSNQAMQRVRRLLDAQKAGHGGALDPMADGVLPILLGDATRLSQYALDGNKAYRFGMIFGAETDSGDAEGEITRKCEHQAPNAEQIQAILPSFVGSQTQVPPMYSALKRDGQPLYKLARKGIEVEREPRSIVVHSLTLLSVDGPRAVLEASVSKGTYIRTLAMDIARRLNHCAHLFSLRRTAAAGLQGPLLTLQRLEGIAEDQRRLHVLPVDTLLPDWPKRKINAAAVEAIRHGQPVDDPQGHALQPGERAFLTDGTSRIVAVGCAKNAQWWPERVYAEDAWQPALSTNECP